MPQRPKFTRQHYREIALVLELTRPASSEYMGFETPEFTKWHHIVDRMVFMFQMDNANFDRERFLTWCYHG